jgi:CelD/BcsL family acetyltransferase involved in cellulose biosynthesis
MHAPFQPTVRAEWRRLAGLGDIIEEWRKLAGRAREPNVFYEPAFALTAAPVFGADAGAVLVWSERNLIGLFPMRTERRGPLTRLAGWTHPFAPLGTPLVDREHADAAISAFLDHLAADRALPPLLLLRLFPDDGPLAAALDRALSDRDYAQASFNSHRRALLAPGAERTGYLDRAMPPRKRKELRRQRRRLEESAPLAFSSADTWPGIQVALQDFVELEASGWKGAAGTAASDDPAVLEFFRTAIVDLAAEGHARVDRLTHGDRVIAAAVTLTSGNTAWFWKIAYSEDLARSSPGVQLVMDCTERLLAEGGPARVDSCAAADHPMIDHIWRERLTLSDRLIAVRRPPLPFALVCRAEALERAAIAAAKTVRNRLRG